MASNADRALRAAQAVFRDRRLRIGAAVIGFGLASLFAVLIAYPAIHVTFQEDEGYMLTTLKSFLHRGHLYDRVFSQYGPFYTEFWAGIFSLFGLPVTPDAARDLTMVAWVACSLGFGLAMLRITGSIFIGIAVQVLTFAMLTVLTGEPLHPGGLICMLLVAVVLVAGFVTDRRAELLMAALGALLAALVLTKINVGGLALISFGLVCTVTYPVLSARRLSRSAIELIFVLVPLLLVSSKAGEAWAWHLGLHVSIAAVGVVIALRARQSDRREDGELWWVVGGFLVLAVLICGTTIASGTSFGALFEGVVTQPLHQDEAFFLPLDLPAHIWAFDAVGLACALAYWAQARSATPASTVLRKAASVASVLLGIEIGLTLVANSLPANPVTLSGSPVSLLAFTWVALVPPLGGTRRASFAVLFLPTLAVLQPLHAFPVAGSQLYWGSFPLVGVAAICVANGARGLWAMTAERPEREVLFAFAALAALALTVFTVNGTVREPLIESRNAYGARQPLDLPGAADVRLEEGEDDGLRAITAAIVSNCPASFLAEPGMDSFYIWSQMEPPTGLNATAWMTLFDDAKQRQVIEETRSIERLCLLRDKGIAEFWSAGPVPRGPLVEYLHKGFRSIATFGEYELLRREGTGPSPTKGRPS
ncbi:MAG: hypothetical protein JWO14_3628 [Solirubrobacterales bacterium]|nr:hypothetical protein [Solirubrobacterales bacterium]